MTEPERRAPDAGEDDSLSARRWRLAREVLVFQGKMLLEGLRDAMLPPATILAALVGLLSRDPNPERPYREILRMGRRFDSWLGLFAPVEDEPGDPGKARGRRSGVDRLVDRVEETLRAEIESPPRPPRPRQRD